MQLFAYFPKIVSLIKENLIQVQKHFTFNVISVLKSKSLFMAKLPWPVFKYQVYLYGSEAITYLNDIMCVVTAPAL